MWARQERASMGGCLPEVRSFFEENKIKESRTIDEIQIA
jgi:hypothetical protein